MTFREALSRNSMFHPKLTKDPAVTEAVKESDAKLQTNDRLQREIAAIAQEIKRRGTTGVQPRGRRIHP